MVDMDMINLDDISDSKLSFKHLRIVFYKHQLSRALVYARELTKKGYILFLQPMVTIDYSNDQFKSLLKSLDFTPYAVSIVDSFGNLDETSLRKYCDIICESLPSTTQVSFHSHANTGRSLLHAHHIIEIMRSHYEDYSLLIDSTLFGMGRGAGNLQTEVLCKYLNDNYNSDYDLIQLLKCCASSLPSSMIKPSLWGYNLFHFATAYMNCHPNYAKFTLDYKPDIHFDDFLGFLESLSPESKVKCRYNSTEILLRNYFEILS